MDLPSANQVNLDAFEPWCVSKHDFIPTNDPVAALQFCQALASLLTSERVPLSAGGFQMPVDNPALLWTNLVSLPDLSVIIPIYNELENLPILYARLSQVLQETGLEYEIVFVDDGSRDSGIELLQQLATKDSRLVCVELARNFGHQVAISAGLEYSRGQAVIIMDGDLQDPPEVLPQFIAKWREGYEVVYAIREKRKEAWWKRLAYAAFYRLLQRVANIEIPLDAGDFCLMDRRVVNALVNMPERTRFMRGIRSWLGFKQIGLAYERHARCAGQPKYTFGQLVRLAVDGLISFSFMPLRVITLLGSGVSLFSIMLAVFYAVKKLTYGLNPPGFATLIVAIFFLAGIQLITMGVIGEYVGRIFEEVKRRPLYIARRVIKG
jgi:polyisoprenyl-phosphate glycosyltransferase